MAKRVIRYMIRYTSNTGERRILASEFKTRMAAKKEIRRILAKPKLNVKGDRRTRRTALRNTFSFGMNNPRIIKRLVFR